MKALRAMLCLAVAASVGLCAEPPGTVTSGWPETVLYRGKRRNAKWLNAAYIHFRTKIARVGKVWIDAERPQRWATKIEPGMGARIAGKVLVLLGEKDCVVRLLQYDLAYLRRSSARYGESSKPWFYDADAQAVRVTGIEVPEGQPMLTGTVAATGTTVVDGRKLVHCVPLPWPREPLSKGAFVEALDSGFLLGRWEHKSKIVNRRTGSRYPVWTRRLVK